MGILEPYGAEGANTPRARAWEGVRLHPPARMVMVYPLGYLQVVARHICLCKCGGRLHNLPGDKRSNLL